MMTQYQLYPGRNGSELDKLGMEMVESVSKGDGVFQELMVIPEFHINESQNGDPLRFYDTANEVFYIPSQTSEII